MATRPTPPPLLAFCRRNTLLRPICPRRLPAWRPGGPPGRQTYYCETRDPHETARQSRDAFPTNRCTFADWGYEAVAALPGLTGGTQVSAWDGTAWFAVQYAPLQPPPWLVHVDVAASVGSSQATTGGMIGHIRRSARPSDALLDPRRPDPVSLGRVRWYGWTGQLVLEPTNVAGGVWAAHLVFAFAAQGVHYAITLHSWASRLRIARRVVTFDAGPALPHVTATLKALVGSAVGRR